MLTKTIILHAMPKEALSFDHLRILTGIGPSQTLCSMHEYSEYLKRIRNIVNVGFVGSDNLPIGTVCMVDTVVYRDYDEEIYNKQESFLCSQLPGTYDFQKVNCLTGMGFYTGGEYKKSGPLDPNLPNVYDMELAAICQFTEKFLPGVRVYSIKIVSDACDVKQYDEFDYKKACDTLSTAIKNIINTLDTKL